MALLEKWFGSRLISLRKTKAENLEKLTWAPSSPDANPCDYCQISKFKTLVYSILVGLILWDFYVF